MYKHKNINIFLDTDQMQITRKI